jgi:hypothetical protein
VTQTLRAQVGSCDHLPMPRIAGTIELSAVMDRLAGQRAVFHSEADFQFAFAQTVQAMDPDIRCRLEVPVTTGASARTEYLDLLCTGPAGQTPIEFKYFTRRWSGNVVDEHFELRNHAAADLLRLHFVHDLVRLERYEYSDPGLAILLSNDPGPWTESTKPTRDRDFRLHDGRLLQGTLLWADGDYVDNARELRGSYTVRWRDYRRLDNTGGGTLRYLALEVAPSEA